jgi:polysaccharide export outer membrane protein
MSKCNVILIVALLGALAARAQEPAIAAQAAQAVPALPAVPAMPSVQVEPETPDAVDSTDYRLVTNDVIQIKVFQEADLDSVLRISKEGTVTFPLIGAVQVGGKTPQDAALSIKALLAKDYLVNPQVSLTVVEYAKQRFTVLGQVQRPGSYDLPDRDALTLIQAIGVAGGYTRIADPGKIVLKRTLDGKESVLHLNAKKMAGGATASSFDVRAGDIITVGESIF